jgi:hypothetical protein
MNHALSSLRRPATLPPVRRWAVLAAGVALGLGVGLVVRLVAPAADPFIPGLVAGAPMICSVALAFCLDEQAIEAFLPIIVCGAIAVLIVALAAHAPDQVALPFGFGSVGLMIVGGYSLTKSTRWRPISRRLANWVVGLVLMATIAFYCVYYVAISRGLMFGDFMYRRIEAIIVASIIDQGQLVALVRLFIGSMKDEYSLLPVLGPGAALAATAPLSRACYTGAIIALYAAPAYFALGILARDLARRASPSRSASFNRPIVLALAACAALVSYPTGMAVVARGMPDIGGLVLVVAALRLCDRLARLLALPSGHDARVGQFLRRVVLALALCLFGMFLFRRYYAFAAVGIVAMLALEVALLAAKRRASFRWRQTISAAALGALSLLALSAPVLIDWLPDPGAHDYATIYAAYRKELSVFVSEICDWYGAALLVAAACCAIFLAIRSPDSRLLRLTCGSCAISALLFLRIQSPAIHHVFLLTPAFAGSIGAAILLAFERRRTAGVIVAAALAAATLTPAVSAFTPAGFAPTAGRPSAPRSDLAELARLKEWVQSHATPEHRYCVLASSYTINDAIVDELWQMDADGSPLTAKGETRINVGMAHVDARDGLPVDKLKECAIMMVGDPVQTHLVPAYQQNVIVPASEMLEGTGIGALYRRNGEVFDLEKGVKLIAFDRIRPLDDSDMADLRARWRAARASNVDGLRGTIGN